MIEKNIKIIDKIKEFRKIFFKNYSNSFIKIDDLLNHIDLQNSWQPPKKFHVHEHKHGYIRFIQNRDYDNNNHITYIPVSKRNSICQKDDIMIDKYGEAGKIRYGLFGAYNVALSKICVKDKFKKEYIRDFLIQENIEKLLFLSSRASTRSSLNISCFKGIKIPLLSENEFEKYELFMSKLLIYELMIKDKNKKLHLIKQTLLNKYF
ncbi:restriction endonuclease subunit S [Mycoplasma elephantis]|uniref:restriction endonuclease subunit S n=1 Tax=Mycoplasma elephantis TaxID=114882 RepID=UPI0006900DA9|nr:restriction endonuclease subunit S [Mycoplasma elephantis]